MRSAAKNEPFPDDETIMQMRLTFYESLASYDANIFALDATRSIEAIAAEISDRVDQAEQCEVLCQ